MAVQVVRAASEGSRAAVRASQSDGSETATFYRFPSGGQAPVRRRRQWMWRPMPTHPASAATPAVFTREAA